MKTKYQPQLDTATMPRDPAIGAVIDRLLTRLEERNWTLNVVYTREQALARATEAARLIRARHGGKLRQTDVIAHVRATAILETEPVVACAIATILATGTASAARAA